MRNRSAKQIALGGILAALAEVVMCLGGLIPVATYVCPVLCCVLGYAVYLFCGKRIAWAWYGAVAVLSLLIAPDREAALIFLAIGNYPNLKPIFERIKMHALLKMLYFNVSVIAAYWVMLHLLGMDDIVQDTENLGILGLMLLLVIGNITFLLLDKVLSNLRIKIATSDRGNNE